jgi:hypothetical protein
MVKKIKSEKLLEGIISVRPGSFDCQHKSRRRPTKMLAKIGLFTIHQKYLKDRRAVQTYIRQMCGTENKIKSKSADCKEQPLRPVKTKL